MSMSLALSRIARLLTIGVGFLFLLAGVTKLFSSESFARTVVDYELLPPAVSLLVGYLLPWVEVAIGVGLTLGMGGRFILLVAGMMTAAFILAQVTVVSRGLAIECGCFGILDGSGKGSTVGPSTIIRTSAILGAIVLACIAKRVPTYAAVGAAHVRHLSAILAAASFGLLTAGTVHATGVQDDDDNAASWYLRAGARLSSMSGDDRERLRSYVEDGDTAEIDTLLQSFEGVAALVKRGAGEQEAWFAGPYDPFKPRPELAGLRNVALVAQAIAVREVTVDGNCTMIDTLLAFSRHLGADHSTGAARLATIVQHDVFDLTISGVDRGALDAAQAGKYHRQLSQWDPNDPASILESLILERSEFEGWVEAALDDPEQRTRLDAIARLPGYSGEVTSRLLSMSELERVESSLAFQRFTAEVDLILAAPPSDLTNERLAKLQSDLHAGEYGPLAIAYVEFQQAIPLETIREDLLASREAYRETVQLLHRIASGEESDNAAVWYLQGIEMLRGVVEGSGIERDAQEQEAAQMFKKGSECPRCDFSIARTAQSFAGESYQIGMYDAIECVLTMSRAAETPVAASDYLAVALEMIRHLAADGRVLSSLISHTELASIALLLRDANIVQSVQVKTAINRFSTFDPLGYLTAHAEMADFLVREWIGLLDRPTIEHAKRIRDYVWRCDLEQAQFFCLAFLDIHRLRVELTTEARIPIIDVDDVETAFAESERLRQLLRDFPQVGGEIAAVPLFAAHKRALESRSHFFELRSLVNAAHERVPPIE